MNLSRQPFRVGSVPYLNAVPLTYGLEGQIDFLPPAQLALKLREGRLDAALVSVTEVLFNRGYDILDGIAVSGRGKVRSVFLAHRRPLEAIKIIWCDTASLTSVNLLRVLLAERGLQPMFKPLPDYASAIDLDAVLLIGNPAIDFLRSSPPHSLWDLGDAWFELSGLPFVYAVWALRQGLENLQLKHRLKEASSRGLENLDYIIRTRTDYDFDFRNAYLREHIHYTLGESEKRGLEMFIALLRKHSKETVYDPTFV